MVASLLMLLSLTFSNEQVEVIVYTAVWCAPCKVYKEGLSKDLPKEAFQSIKFIEISDDEVVRLKIEAIPTTLFLHRGKELGRLRGAIKASIFSQKVHDLNEHISRNRRSASD